MGSRPISWTGSARCVSPSDGGDRPAQPGGTITGPAQETTAAAVVVRELTAHDAALVAGWRYEGPWAVYDPAGDGAVSADHGYHAIAERGTGRFVGYVCLGAEARVAGLDPRPGVVDVGVGLDPAVVGRGRGRSIAGPVLEWVERTTGAVALRAVVQSWNRRSLRLCERLGFEATGHHLAPGPGSPVDYVVLERRRSAPDGPDEAYGNRRYGAAVAEREVRRAVRRPG